MKYFVIYMMILTLSCPAWAQSQGPNYCDPSRPIWTVPNLSDMGSITVHERDGSITMGTIDRQNKTWSTWNTDSDHTERGSIDQQGNVSVYEDD
jgi:hypothetical protein